MIFQSIRYTIGAKAARVNNLLIEWSDRRRTRRLGTLVRHIHFSPQATWRPLIEDGFAHVHGLDLTFGPLSQEVLNTTDVVVPLSVDDALKLANMRTAGVKGIHLGAPPAVIELCHNKIKFNNHMADLGFADYVPPMNCHKGRFPYILKKAVDECSANTFVIKNAQDEAKYAEQLADPGFFTQSFIPGKKEYATHVLFLGGKIIKELTVEYSFESHTPVKGKNPSYGKMISTPHLAILEAMLEKLNYTGLGCFNYKVVDGKPWIIELNPRFGGSLCRHFPSFILALLEWKSNNRASTV